jgi:molecular chaperone HtpG
MENYKDFLPEYLRFVRGLVDSPDFSLNISREILQHSGQLQKIVKNLELSILKALEGLLNKERSKYETFWKEYGKAIKNGVYSEFRSREKLQELLLFSSSNDNDGLTTLGEYASRMHEGQKTIYYATGKDRAAVERLPQMELLNEKGIEVLYLFERVDEFAIDALSKYKDFKFQSISRGDLNLDDIEADQETKNETDNLTKENETLLQRIKNQLEGKVAEVKISNRLKSSPVCLVSDNNSISLSMEQILSELDRAPFKAKRILELNPRHDVFQVLKKLHEQDQSSEAFKNYCEILYGQALLMEGIIPEDPIGFADKVTALMSKI